MPLERKPCPCQDCKGTLRLYPLCAWHWLQLEPRVRNQITQGKIPLSFGVLMIKALEDGEIRQEKIDEGVVRL